MTEQASECCEFNEQGSVICQPNQVKGGRHNIEFPTGATIHARIGHTSRSNTEVTPNVMSRQTKDAPAPSAPATIPKAMKFFFGGTAGMGATCFVQPLDLVKNRMQIMKKQPGPKPTSLSVITSVVKNEGVMKLYNGLSAGLLRQATYTTTRLGIYTWLFENFSNPDGSPPSFFMKAALGMTAGACGAFVGTPAEVALIRMTSDGNLPADQRRNYKNVFEALARIFREEGLFTLWRGAIPTMGRAMVVNAAQLSSYSQAKQAIMGSGYVDDGIFCHFLASMFSGLVTTAASMPVDIAKTRIQNMTIVDGKPEYRGALDVILKVAKNEGFFSLWKGFTPYYFRLGPHTVLTFIFLEQMNRQYKVHVLGQTEAKGGGL
ncbi:mitochondrial 2-oxoglutarate/malate carrier protein-like isoform X2 [Tigriopus californicus]|uniref:mitochondrial 2-oxoglutarate/malate carrier protein-like isoform X2 n=1 Tax=Tigriopus californicus TaxID=6832 RepID=UPI0027DA5D6E|nr:mitochondrial 2-oxoglutarate/malate carrier protein-like isoform X2 [Tigriopus californicus]